MWDINTNSINAKDVGIFNMPTSAPTITSDSNRILNILNKQMKTKTCSNGKNSVDENVPQKKLGRPKSENANSGTSSSQVPNKPDIMQSSAPEESLVLGTYEDICLYIKTVFYKKDKDYPLPVFLESKIKRLASGPLDSHKPEGAPLFYPYSVIFETLKKIAPSVTASMEKDAAKFAENDNYRANYLYKALSNQIYQVWREIHDDELRQDRALSMAAKGFIYLPPAGEPVNPESETHDTPKSVLKSEKSSRMSSRELQKKFKDYL
jgi:hypothetical protein